MVTAQHKLRRILLAIILVLLVATAVLTVLRYCFKGKRQFAALFYMSVPGVGSLIAMNMLSAYTGIVIPLNLYNLLTSVFLGLPGITGLVIKGFVA